MRINNSRRLSFLVCQCKCYKVRPVSVQKYFLVTKNIFRNQKYFTPSQCRRKTRWRSPADPRQSARGRMSWGGALRSFCWAARPPSGPWHSVWITWTSWLWPVTARCSRPSAGSCLTSAGPMSEMKSENVCKYLNLSVFMIGINPSKERRLLTWSVKFSERARSCKYFQ